MMISVLAIGFFTISVYFAILGSLAFDKLVNKSPNTTQTIVSDSKIK